MVATEMTVHVTPHITGQVILHGKQMETGDKQTCSQLRGANPRNDTGISSPIVATKQEEYRRGCSRNLHISVGGSGSVRHFRHSGARGDGGLQPEAAAHPLARTIDVTKEIEKFNEGRVIQNRRYISVWQCKSI